MRNTLLNIKSRLTKCDKQVSKLADSIKRLVAEHGGFIDTRNPNGAWDSIFAYVYDENGRVEERFVYGIRIVEGVLEVATAPILDNTYVEWGDDDFADSNNWAPIDGGVLLRWQTVLSIADSIWEYV